MSAPATKMPVDFNTALKKSHKASSLWVGLTPVSQRDFITWITSAKQEKTRERRVKVAISKLLSGQRRPCCYAVVPMNLYKAIGELPKAKAQWSSLSADEKRDFSDWVNAGKDSGERSERVEKSVVQLLRGKRTP